MPRHLPPSLLGLLALLLLLLPSLPLAQTNDDGSIPAAQAVPGAIIPDPRTTIRDFLATDFDDFEVLLALISALDLTGSLAIPSGRSTVFAPPDNAFIDFIRRVRPDLALDLDTFDTPAIVDALNLTLQPFRNFEVSSFVSPRDFVAYHILNDALDYDSIEDQSPLNTSAGIELSVVDGFIVDQDPEQDIFPSARNIFNLNGYVHVVPQLLLPFDLTRAINEIPTPSPSISPSASPSGDGTAPSVAPTVTPAPIDPEESAGPIIVTPTDPPIVSESPMMMEPMEVSESPMVSGEDDGSDGEGPDESPEDDDPVCFPPGATVELADGSRVTMGELRAGDQVRVHEDGRVSAVFAWTHRMRTRKGIFYALKTLSGHQVRMTGGHYVYANGVLTAARAVKVGDVLRTVEGESVVSEVGVEKGEGLFAPHTMHGDVVVDGVVVSGYSRAVAPWVAHALLAPVRGLVRWGGVTEPLGGLFYGGADEVARWMPSGRERY